MNDPIKQSPERAKSIRENEGDPHVGAVRNDATCTICGRDGVMVIYTHTESWGDNPARPIGSVQFWACGRCTTDEEKASAANEAENIADEHMTKLEARADYWKTIDTALTHGPIGQLAEEYGLEVCHTGGGCWSLGFTTELGDENAGRVMLLINPLDEEQAEVVFELPEGNDTPVMIGMHYDEADYDMPQEMIDRLLALGFKGVHPTEFYWVPVALAHGLEQVREIVGQR
jgi:hypothetical protein